MIPSDTSRMPIHVPKRSEAELRALGEQERAVLAAREQRYLERLRRRHQRLGLIGFLLTLPMLLFLHWCGGVPLAGWIVEPLMGALGAWLISRWQPNLLVSGVLVGVSMLLGMALCTACGWWHTNPIQCLFAALGLGLVMLGAGTIALHLEMADDP